MMNISSSAYTELVAERDRFADEVAELRGKLCDAGNANTIIIRDLATTNAAYATLLESHEQLLAALTESDETLEKLREAVPEGIRTYGGGDALLALESVYFILYPQTKESTT